jgi:hypothetical protein
MGGADEESMFPEDFDPSVFDQDEVDALLAGLAARLLHDR